MEANIQILIKEKTAYGDYNDAKYYYYKDLPVYMQEVLDRFTAEYSQEISDLTQERVNNWILNQTTPPVIVEPTKAELEKQELDMQRELNEVKTKLAEIS